MLLLAPVVFVDGFLRDTLQKRAANGYYLRLLNHELEVQNIVLTGPLTSLENGEFSCFFAKTQQVESFYRSLYLRFGNNIGHRGSIGLFGPTAFIPSRFFEDRPAEKFHKVHHPFSRKPRNIENHKTIINQIQLDRVTRGKKSTAKKDAKELGFTLKRSNMWDIKVFSKNFFWSHTNCYLHLEKEGMLHRWLKYLGSSTEKLCVRQLIWS